MEYSVGTMCEVLGICRSAYYRWTDGGNRSDEKAKEDEMLKMEIQKIHKCSRKVYGKLKPGEKGESAAVKRNVSR